MIKNIHHFIDILIVLIRRVILISAQPLLGLVLRIQRKSRFLTAATQCGVNICLKRQHRKPLACGQGTFWKDPAIFRARKAALHTAVFAFKIKVSTILEIIQRNYHLTKQNLLVCNLGTVLLFNRLPAGLG